MKKYFYVIVYAVFVASIGAPVLAQAQTVDAATIESQIQMLQARVLVLQELFKTIQILSDETVRETSLALNLPEYTGSFLKIADELKSSSASERQAIMVRLATFAKERKTAMLLVMKTNPQAVIQNALPASVRQTLPSEIQPDVESEATLEGILEVLHVDGARPNQLFTDADSRYLYNLEEANGNKTNLFFSTNAPALISGDKIRVRGIKLDNNLAAAGGSGSVIALTTSPSVLISSSGATARKELVILVNFSDQAGQPYTIASAQDMMNTTNKFYLENSYNKVGLTGVKDPTQAADVAGWFTIAAPHAPCDSNTWASQANSAAAAAGYNLANYSGFIYVLDTGSCSWPAMATIGGSPPKVWIIGFYLYDFLHELGHNFGLYHSHSLECTGATCTLIEYGDMFDTMGSGFDGFHFNTFQKERLGWLNSSISPPTIITVTVSGVYTIAPYEMNNGSPKALKILKNGSTNTYYYIEYRAGLGFDATLPTAVIVHTAAQTDPNSSDLWDLDRVSSADDWQLDVGQTYTDAIAGISFKLLAMDMTGATVQVNYSGDIPDPIPPTVSLTAPANGTTVSGSVTVSANASDNTAVANVQFLLDGSALGSPVSTSPYTFSWDTTTASNGSHTLSAVATDIWGNQATAASISVAVKGGISPNPTPTLASIIPSSSNVATVSISAMSGTNFIPGWDKEAGLLANWRMDESSSLTVSDVSGNGHPGIATGTTVVNGKINHARNFNGTSDSVDAGTLNLSANALTMTAWINPTKFQAAGPNISSIMGEENNSGSNDAMLRLGDSGSGLASNLAQFVLTFGGPMKLNGKTPLSTGRWTFIAATYDGSTMRLYVNGVLDVSVPRTGSFTANGDFQIGSNPSNGRYFNGSIDEARIYSHALTGAEVSQLYYAIQDPIVKLTKTGQSDIVGTGFALQNSTQLTGGSFNIASAVSGPWNVLVTDPDGQSATLANGFSIGVSDTTPPTVPTGLSASAISPSQINLFWTASTDNVGVTGYHVYRDGTPIASPGTTSYSDTNLTAGTTYSYAVSAYDAAGNASAQSGSVSATTPLVKFQIGQRVKVTTKLAVRARPSTSGRLLGYQSKGSLGTIVGGPASSPSGGGPIYWNVNYDKGYDGWSVEGGLVSTP